MKGSLIIIGFFIVGVLVGMGDYIPSDLLPKDLNQYVLYVLMLLVGITIGYDKELLRSLRNTNLKILLVPIGTILGTLLGTALIGLFIPEWSITECMAVGSGFGYYSLSSIFITKYKGAALGTIALMSNIMREIFALLATPLLVRWFGKLSPISVAGATSMDTCLPIITQYSGRDFVLIAIAHGIIVDLTVPFLVTFFCSF
ncbi:lysine exporter LysO family protein [Sphingobacterium psychroaquaticum]|uniref:lysine exporter LysO family protein n=1 Tax=Sphingobacterium psychroaquaticum TaxID=561061 RepID=UPI0010692EB4|nr:lysine exporter LysO family protein [Sphingobacterium psychroaquaticum]QBQ41893.1 lysine exporter LysO family protein [Sphingobacterium psychroaquaticum]